MADTPEATPESSEVVEPTAPAVPTDPPTESTEVPLSDDAAAEVAASHETDSELKARLSPEDYAYVQELRGENKNIRTAFEGFEPEWTSAMLEAIRAIKENPSLAAEEFGGLAKALAEAAGITEEEAQDAIDDAVDDGSEELTVEEQIAKALADREEAEKAAEAARKEQEAEDKARKELDETVEALGYKPNSEDPDEKADFIELLHFATTQTNGDLDAAHAAVQARHQKRIDAFLAAQEAQTDEVPPVTSGSAPAERPEKIRNVKDAARKAKHAVLRTADAE